MAQELRYQADGLNMIGSLHRPAKGRKAPGVLVFPEAFGLGEHAMSYDDLILSLFADRIDVMLMRQRGMYPHVEELLR